MQAIYLVRHGETLANVAGQWQGEHDPLSEAGHQQARQISERLRKLPFDAVFCSTMARARDTAATIMQHHDTPVTYTTTLAERRVPSSTIGVVRESVPDNPAQQFLTAWEGAGRNPDFRYEDEETVREVVARAGAALGEMGDSGAEQVLAVTHGTMLRVIINTVLNGGDTSDPYTIFSAGRYMQTTHVGLSVLLREDKTTSWRLRTYNDHAHFADN
jgi:broad specificity phosphatase PhoE